MEATVAETGHRLLVFDELGSTGRTYCTSGELIDMQDHGYSLQSWQRRTGIHAFLLSICGFEDLLRHLDYSS